VYWWNGGRFLFVSNKYRINCFKHTPLSLKTHPPTQAKEKQTKLCGNERLKGLNWRENHIILVEKFPTIVHHQSLKTLPASYFSLTNMLRFSWCIKTDLEVILKPYSAAQKVCFDLFENRFQVDFKSNKHKVSKWETANLNLNLFLNLASSKLTQFYLFQKKSNAGEFYMLMTFLLLLSFSFWGQLRKEDLCITLEKLVVLFLFQWKSF